MGIVVIGFVAPPLAPAPKIRFFEVDDRSMSFEVPVDARSFEVD
jgi:hypothetical protein